VSWQSDVDALRAFENKAAWHDPRQSYANFVLTNSPTPTAWTAAAQVSRPP
jgi:hypothetical protein